MLFYFLFLVICLSLLTFWFKIVYKDFYVKIWIGMNTIELQSKPSSFRVSRSGSKSAAPRLAHCTSNFLPRRTPATECPPSCHTTMPLPPCLHAVQPGALLVCATARLLPALRFERCFPPESDREAGVNLCLVKRTSHGWSVCDCQVSQR